MFMYDYLNVGIFDGVDKLQMLVKGLNKFEYFFMQQLVLFFDLNDVIVWQQEGLCVGMMYVDVVNVFKWFKLNYLNISYGLINYLLCNLGKYMVVDFCEFNDMVFDIMFGIEGMVGNQMEFDCGGYISVYIDVNLKN